MISVCLATYNGEKFIKEQLDSILVQLGEGDEVVISDDNSTDNTIEIIKEYNDSRIKIFHNPFTGTVKNFENALIYSSGDYIFLSDQDDIWFKNKIEVCIADFQKGYDLVLSDCIVFNSDSSEIIMNSYFDFIGAKKGIVRNVVKNAYMGCCMAFTQKVKNKIVPFPEDIPMHDSWIGLISEIYFKVKFNKKKLVRYRRHSKNASDTGAKRGAAPFMMKIKGRVLLGYNLITHFLKDKIHFTKSRI